MLKKFASYYKPHMKLFILDMVCAFTVSVLNLAYPKIAGKIIEVKQLDYVLTFSAVLLGIFLLKAALNYIIVYWGHVVGVRIQGDMRAELFAHLQKLPFAYYDETKVGSIMSRLVNDLFEVSELAHHGPEDVFLSVLSIIGALIMICFINPWLSLILLAIIPIMVFVASRLRMNLIRAFSASREKTSEINAAVESSISGIRVAKAYTAERHEKEKFVAANEGLKAARSMQYKAMSRFNTAMSLSMDILYLVAFAAGGLFFVKDLISSADLTSYVLYVAMLVTPIRTFVAIFEQIEEGMTGFKRFMEVMSVAPEKETENPVKVDRLKGDIVFDNVSFRYKKESDDEKSLILNDLSLEIKAGSTIALVGPSGGGKTTLCNLIPRFYDIDSGRITIDGIDIDDMSLYDLRRNVGSVAQDVFIFSGTVKENIAYGDFDATDEQIENAAKLANADYFIRHLPDGYNTMLTGDGENLSQGQRQLLAIARAAVANPPVLILDEATSSIDTRTEKLIEQGMDKLMQGRTVFVIAHRLSTVRNSDMICVLEHGEIIERGNHEQLIAQRGRYYQLYTGAFELE